MVTVDSVEYEVVLISTGGLLVVDVTEQCSPAHEDFDVLEELSQFSPSQCSEEMVIELLETELSLVELVETELSVGVELLELSVDVEAVETELRADVELLDTGLSLDVKSLTTDSLVVILQLSSVQLSELEEVSFDSLIELEVLPEAVGDGEDSDVVVPLVDSE